jgi:hypothetical protein
MARIIDVSLLRTLGQYLVERDSSTGVDLIIVRIKAGKHVNADAPQVGNGDVLVMLSAAYAALRSGATSNG